MAASDGGLITVQRISRGQAIPPKFLRHILAELRRTGLLRSHRGPGAGYALARPAQDITLEEIESRESEKIRLDGSEIA